MVMLRVVALVGGVLGYPKTLEEVYGPMEPVDSMNAPWKKSNDRASRSDSFHVHRTSERCDFPIDVLLVQDATASFDDNFASMVNTQLPAMVSGLTKSHPGSRFAGMSFRDKPIEPFGNPETDYCQRIGLDFSLDVTSLTDYYATLTRVGGGDPAENQFGALMAAGQTFEVNWTSNVDSANLIVLVTDAPPHFEGDGNDVQNMTPNTGLYIDELAERQCTTQYYPNPDQVLFSIMAAQAYLTTIVYDPEYWNGLPGSSWQWFNRFIGQTDAFVNIGAQDNSDFWAKLSQIIQAIEDIECGPVLPSEVPVTTTPPAVATPVGTVEATETVVEDTTLSAYATPLLSIPVLPTETIVADNTLSAYATPLVSVPVARESTVEDTTLSAYATPLITTGVATETSPTTATTTPHGPSENASVPIECEANRVCEDGVQLKFLKKPEDLEIIINGKPIDIA